MPIKTTKKVDPPRDSDPHVNLKRWRVLWLMLDGIFCRLDNIRKAIEDLKKHPTRPRRRTLVVIIGSERKLGDQGESNMNAIHIGFKRPITLLPKDVDGTPDTLDGAATGSFFDIIDPATGNPFTPGGSPNFAFVPDLNNPDNLHYFVECRGLGQVTLQVKGDANKDPNVTDLIEFDSDFQGVSKQAVIMDATIGDEIPI